MLCAKDLYQQANQLIPLKKLRLAELLDILLAQPRRLTLYHFPYLTMQFL